MARKFLVTTTVNGKKFFRTFNKVSSVDAYLAGAKALRKQHPKAAKAEVRIQAKDTTKKTLTKGVVKFI